MLIEKIVENKNMMVAELLEAINKTNDHELRTNLVFILIDNFKDDRIILSLINLIKREDLKHHNGSLIFACNEYNSDECKPYLELFIDIIINGDYEASMNSAGLILDFQEPYEWEEDLLNELKTKLQLAFKSDKKNKEFIEAILKILSED
jgi:hypothetical protein